MEQPGVVALNFAPSFSLNFLSIFVHISGSIRPITLIWASLERCFPPAQVEYRWCQTWSRGMTSEVEEGQRFTTAGYGRHGRTGLNNVCACARSHGLRWRQWPGRHTKPRKTGDWNSRPRTEQWPRQIASGDLGVLSSSCSLNKLASPLIGLCMCAIKQ